MSDTIIDSLTPLLDALQTSGVTARDVHALYHIGATTATVAPYWAAQISEAGLFHVAQHTHTAPDLREVADWVQASVSLGDDVAWCRLEWANLSDEERGRVERVGLEAAP